ncbi:hypothetical protein [Micromonospora sp. RP3T]|uniref:hypothetical protein n=1 Tax=Micromonospora sp. RP3T TaxID=2135446 RepID=UPI003D733001
MRDTTTPTECDECGEDLHPGRDCRTAAEILAEAAPPADYTARFRAERAASIARADAAAVRTLTPQQPAGQADIPRTCVACEHRHAEGVACRKRTPAVGSSFSPLCGCAA